MLNFPVKKHGFYPIFDRCLCSRELKWTVPITVITYAAGTRITAVAFTVCWKTTTCFSRLEHWHTVHATLLLTCAPTCQSSLNCKVASNSLDLNPVDYSVWTALQQMVHHHKMSDNDRLKREIIDCCTQLSQDTINWVINQPTKR